MVRLLFITYFFINAIGCSNADTTALGYTKRSSGFSIKGISMVAPQNIIDSMALKPIADIHANSISLMPYAFCTIENPEVRYNQHDQHWGENIEGVIGCIKLAHQKNISVMLKPHLWIGHGIYTGAFTLNTEKEWQIWEASYQKYMLHFAAIADSMKAEIFCIGTELGTFIKMRPQFWNSFIDTIKKIYHGKLTYAANWDDYKNFPFWDKLDYIGVDAYFPLSAGETPSVNSLKNGWKQYGEELEKISIEHNRPILFTEYGYRNVDYNSAEPWKENEGKQNDEAQVNAYEAFYESFAGKKWFAGGFVWKWFVDNGRHRRNSIDFTPQSKPAAKSLESWYRN
ncbi:MAG TPA: hypothetical protein VGP43_07390 [Chitinophagaceae bacterium]|nr:hypothetical protein [Chitinophagaceae bacterium]